MKIGLICPTYPPSFGGAEKYEHNFGLCLESLGHEVSVFTGRSEDKQKFNGVLNVHRCNTYGEFAGVSFWGLAQHHSAEYLSKLISHYNLIESAITWIDNNKFDLVIVGNGFAVAPMIHARELYAVVRSKGIPIGLIHHDNSAKIEANLKQIYLDTGRSWDDAANLLIDALRTSKGELDELSFLIFGIESPLLLRPDFVICNSQWTRRFIDPFETVPSFVFHPPLISNENNKSMGNNPTSLSRVDVTFVNPQTRKNPELMLAIIQQNPNLTYRILEGGWGNAFATFKPAVEKTAAFRGGNIELIRHLPDITDAYMNTEALVFPSYAEGYGMTAVEPLRYGVGVLASSYPSIIEALGNGGLLKCPYRDSCQDWTEGLTELLSERAFWRTKALGRIEEISKRDKQELSALNEFVTKIGTNSA
jgi:glycosyltransferase involved in cell wall biosynthesis